MAQDFPKKGPIRIIVPVPPGGSTDVLARITAEALQRRLGQIVIVENKPGASSTIGTDLVARSPADGYTILFGGAEFAGVPTVGSCLRVRRHRVSPRAFTVSPVLVASPKYSATTIQNWLPT
jgi:tripartite-type tricarboxylate transporter receptor subunit TctC